jgi:D-lactate dehydrogenase (cytochrome)
MAPIHRINAQSIDLSDTPRIDRDPDVVRAFLSDAAHVPGGFSDGVAFPANEREVAALVASAGSVLPVGAQSSLTGGATPRGDVVLSTRALNAIELPGGRVVRAGAGVALSTLQRAVDTAGLYYPPVPTFDGASVGGIVATNAAGAATFKYGATRRWIEALTIVLADGSLLDVRRGQTLASPDGTFEVDFPSCRTATLHIPTYVMPDVPKLSAGYYTRPGMDLVDLFVGSEGTLGVVVDATLNVIPRPNTCVVLVACVSDAQALGLTSALREEATRAWRGQGPLDVSAVEYLDYRTLRLIPDATFARTGTRRPSGQGALLLLQVELADNERDALERLQQLLDSHGVISDPDVAMPGHQQGAERIFELRESAPLAVNSHIAAAKAAVHPDIQKTAGDMVVPFGKLADSLALYRHAFERRGLDYAIWGHLSDGNLHPNVVPRSLDDVELGREALLEIGRGVIGMGGAPLAEHGVGKNALKQRLLVELYGREGVDEMRAVKQALDPEWKLASGVIFSRQ